MATTRPSKLPANLKDRIAALERTTNNATSPPTSPTASTAPTAYNAQAVGTLKDKIAKFERKGGIPVPRGSFGLGAPPTAEGPKRQGELYGNRIQALTPQYTGGSITSIGSSFANSSQRRSFSASVLTGNFDDSYLDYTPIPSPPSVDPPGSPESSNSPELSPSRSTNGDISVVRRNAARGTSFYEALEFARKVEAAKKAASKLPIKKKSEDSTDATETPLEEATTVSVLNFGSEEAGTLDPTPAILVSFDDPVADESTIASAPQEDRFPMVDVETLVDAPEDLSLARSTIAGSDEQIATAGDSIAGLSTPSDAGNDTSTPKVPALSSQSVPVTKVPESTLSLPPRLEIQHGGKGDESTPIRLETQRGSKDDESKPIGPETQRGVKDDESTPIRLETSSGVKDESTPIRLETQSGVKDNQSTPIRLEIPRCSNDDKSTRIESTSLQTPQIVLDDNGNGLSVADVAASVAPKDVDISTVSRNAVPVEASAPATDNVDEPPLKTRSQIPVPRTRPTIQPPDASSFLSPPSSGFRSTQVSSGASTSPVSSVGSRPISMIEMSPSEVSRALKMTPATGRGIPLFVAPANAQTRKTDFVFFPLSPEHNANTETGGEEPSLAHHKAGSETDLASKTYKAVVHGKVKETLASATLPMRHFVPETPMKDHKRATILQSPLSPGHGELAALLQEAMWLEDTLNKGELPGESPKDEPTSVGVVATSKPLSVAKSKEEERQRASASLRTKRDGPTHGRLKHTFLMPLSKARVAQKQEAKLEVSTPVEQPGPRGSREDSRPITVSDHVGGKEVQEEKSATQQSPSKIPKLSKFPSFKKFGSISRTVAQQEALLRHSNSTSSEISSEDSNLIVTPPDNAVMEFGERRSISRDVDQQSAHSQSLSFSFPSLSPKKGVGLGRAASFAEKMWSRARTKSNGSVLSSSGFTHRSTEELTPQLPVLSELPPIPSLPSIGPPLTENNPALHRPASGSSLRNQLDMAGSSTTPRIHSVPRSALPMTAVPENVPSVPHNNTANQPFSPMSMSSIGSLPSPLFDKDICDAFPAVPTGTPGQLPSIYLPRSGGQSLAAAYTDFDSALLSSAIHLAARNKASAPSDYAAAPTSAQTR